MIKTEYIDSSNYEVLSFSLRLLTSIYKTNKNINGIYINYLYRDSLSVVRMILISDKSLSQEELSRFDIMIDSFYSPVYTAFIEPKGSFPSTFKGMRLLSVEIHAEILSLVFLPVLS